MTYRLLAAGRRCPILNPGPRCFGAGAPQRRQGSTRLRVFGSSSLDHRSTMGSNDNLDDDHYPAYTMGRAAEMIGATPGFLRSLDEAKLLVPQRSEGGHRRYS